jgi:transcriptional regulator with XRE-family HTH domain
MRNKLDINMILKQGKILNEFELEQASIAERQLKLLSNENPELKSKRAQLIQLIDEYEAKHWTNREEISNSQIVESDQAEKAAFHQLEFIEKRKKLIKSKLKRLGLNQQEFGKILGHDSKSYMSELMNGVVPFTLKDLIVISKLLKINLSKLIPTDISDEEKKKIAKTVEKLGKPELRLDKKQFAFG